MDRYLPEAGSRTSTSPFNDDSDEVCDGEYAERYYKDGALKAKEWFVDSGQHRDDANQPVLEEYYYENGTNKSQGTWRREMLDFLPPAGADYAASRRVL